MLTAAKLEEVQAALSSLETAKQSVLRLTKDEETVEPAHRRDVVLSGLAAKVEDVAREVVRLYT